MNLPVLYKSNKLGNKRPSSFNRKSFAAWSQVLFNLMCMLSNKNGVNKEEERKNQRFYRILAFA